ncbi:hypothetical protein AR457_02465 [Streptomyces agglomeratus]|uniref:Pentapeptide repeat-containing protein n=2 Tax=Streptomyces agglomeratus TaxID=285458 RepID=A0A1E5P1Z6_9ACTN|nr:pentapeptide repeat-containing protein [Streptomyces agglomeratus]OEJ23532.1 hypothetical protein AS594_02565 [Streptomyces agglomeratus]OEJ43126.1 hypothetical protein AR457_02465 [Streptomyces agglomeratus]OEJ54953.1 hypothetical protein BGK72_33315 [Streptomyces agglomeratus]
MLLGMKRQRLRQVLVTFAALVALVLFVVAVWLVPWWLDGFRPATVTSEQATIVSGMRTALVATGAGALAVAGLFYTHHTLRLTREGHITDRFTKAVEQLGSAVIEVRLGGIYALERIMHDSVRDHYAVVQVLAAFVREHARDQSAASTPDPPLVSAVARLVERARRRRSHPAARVKPTEDVQAALTVLGKRPEGRREPKNINLSGARLEGADLRGARLDFAELYDTHLEHALLNRAGLWGTNLSHAHLEHADLANTRLPDANLSGAFLTGTNLWGADLSKTKELTVEQVVAARPARTTVLRPDLEASGRVQERIAQYD